MFFKKPELTAGSRPVLQYDETLLFVQNGVGLYKGKYKVADCQSGHAYLTSHRACYIDDHCPRDNSLAFDLRDVDRYDYTAKFLRSSPKVTIHPKPTRRAPGSVRQDIAIAQSVQRLQLSSSSPGSRSPSPFRPSPIIQVQPTVQTSAIWICPICTFPNPVPSNFDPAVATDSFPIPPCLTCGIKPDFATILKAAISASTARPVNGASLHSAQPELAQDSPLSFPVPGANICPRCTFHNHPSLKTCEICSASLPTTKQSTAINDIPMIRSSSPAPEISHHIESDEPVSMKFSFRAGGDKAFYEKLKSAMIQRKWLASSAPPIPKPIDGLRNSEPSSPTMAGFDTRGSPRSSRVGIAGLEQLGKQTQKENEIVIGAAFEDLESLMHLEKEVSALAQKIAREYGDEANAIDFDTDVLESSRPGMLATRDVNSSETLYISELSRNLAEYVTDEKRGLLRRRGGTMSLVDLWATFNRSRDGVELVSPSEFHKATNMWTTLGLPVRLRQFKSGLMAVQYAYTSDERTIEQLTKWLGTMRAQPDEDMTWDSQCYGTGVTAQDAAKRFGWNLGIANEELEMAEERGALVREESIEGLKFWLNFFDTPGSDDDD